jgi:hypothetical protein
MGQVMTSCKISKNASQLHLTDLVFKTDKFGWENISLCVCFDLTWVLSHLQKRGKNKDTHEIQNSGGDIHQTSNDNFTFFRFLGVP